jgi:hypothetical protein
VKLAPFGVTTLNFDIYRSRFDLVGVGCGRRPTVAAARSLGIQTNLVQSRPGVARAVFYGGNIVTKR